MFPGESWQGPHVGLCDTPPTDRQRRYEEAPVVRAWPALAPLLLLLLVTGCAHRGPAITPEPSEGGGLVEASMAPDTEVVDSTDSSEGEEAQSTKDSARFDIDGDGIAERFDWWWDRDSGAMRLEIWRKRGGSSTRVLRASAPTTGWWTEAWFLDESPIRKAVFMTRFGGSCGAGLFYLDLRKRELELFTDEVYLEDLPRFEDLDGDGQREIFVQGRGRDRTAALGAALYRWDGAAYRLWWPNWEDLPYPVYGALKDLDGDTHPEVVAVLEDERYSDQADSEGRLRGLRRLGVWSIWGGVLQLVTSAALPNATYPGYPQITRVSRKGHRGVIRLTYEERKVVCTYENGKLNCPGAGNQ